MPFLGLRVNVGIRCRVRVKVSVRVRFGVGGIVSDGIAALYNTHTHRRKPRSNQVEK